MKIKILTICFAVTALLTLGSTAGFAHHGQIAYNHDKPITLKGTVTEFAWSNPHVQIYFDVKDANGKIVHWSCETLSPGRLTRAGWKKNSLKPGDPIAVTLIPAKTGAPVGYLHKLVLTATGKELGTQDRPNY